MESCDHLDGLHLAADNSILDPSKWLCSQCGNTEWVWACLSCPNVACGRMNEEHAVQHFEVTKHPVAVEVNAKYVYCYVCDQYIVGDNQSNILETVRGALTALGTLSLEELQNSSGNLLRTYSLTQESSWSQDDENDRLITADMHYRKTLLSKMVAAWQDFVQSERKQKGVLEDQGNEEETATTVRAHPPMLTRARSGHFHMKKRTLIPGVTGLRNLGNTCYINSIIQALGHLDEFREYFSHLVFGLFSPLATPRPSSPLSSRASSPLSPEAARTLLRLNTVDYFQHISSSISSPNKQSATRPPGGLNGGGSTDQLSVQGTEFKSKEEEEMFKAAKLDVLKTLSLCQELHGLLRVLWSGKWAQVSPHGFLHSLWKAIPVFKGHSQHDAQEFLCELLDKVSQEIEHMPQFQGSDNIVDQSFRGELVSQVTCTECQKVSSRHEPFLDLSLEFPRCFQQTNSQAPRMCHITEMLSTFTAEEELEPSSYACEKCNERRSSRRKSQGQVRTDARKQLLISQAPDILRLHLKRFRWCGRNHREKIATHVAFGEELDISPFCNFVPGDVCGYKLNSVVVHHGAGFRAGHYTTYTYNSQAESWLHCNDSRIQVVSLEEVLSSQAYILFYSRHATEVRLDDMPVLTPIASVDARTDTLSTASTVPDLDSETLHTLRQLSQGDTLQALDEEVSFSFHRDQKLVKRLSSGHYDLGKRKLTAPPTDGGGDDVGLGRKVARKKTSL